MALSGITLPPPLALARSAESLTPFEGHRWVYEPKWDGHRACTSGGRLWSRRGVELTRFYPDLAPVLAARLPRTAVIDGELVAWDVAAGRLDFGALQARLTAGRRLAAVAARRPAHLVCFDLLAADGVDLRSQPLATRRALLAEMLSGVGAPIALCQQTDDFAVALDWMQTLSAGGLEGVVAKDPAQPYPIRSGQRIWTKVKSRQTLDMLAVGIIGEASAPTSLVLAMPTGVDDPPAAGATTVLTRTAARALAPLVHPTGVTWTRRSNWASADTVEVQQIETLVVEVSADTAVDGGVLRHAARLIRARPDLQVDDLLAD